MLHTDIPIVPVRPPRSDPRPCSLPLPVRTLGLHHLRSLHRFVAIANVDTPFVAYQIVYALPRAIQAPQMILRRYQDVDALQLALQFALC
ncbi:hypothetical protein SCP_0206640 [Sparassis crispa]|uniref:Uncharacterized protein n=1 Tax=Sparassis crispa TaxID=139825 RepID=A0A401GBC1_9APHY|nr:hypothetical protein SCP_0206640 [Sparassis crispa]GBE79464.1 hypothetical protein SCP_0206640 [Sparassis crispa]